MKDTSFLELTRWLRERKELNIQEETVLCQDCGSMFELYVPEKFEAELYCAYCGKKGLIFM